MEKEKHEIERQRFLIEQQKHQLYMAQLNVNLSQMGIQVADIPTNSTGNGDWCHIVYTNAVETNCLFFLSTKSSVSEQRI